MQVSFGNDYYSVDVFVHETDFFPHIFLIPNVSALKNIKIMGVERKRKMTAVGKKGTLFTLEKNGLTQTAGDEMSFPHFIFHDSGFYKQSHMTSWHLTKFTH